jgi:putative ABC transport system substrate-binding protein
MQRREFITLIGGAAVAPSLLWPLPLSAQQKLPTIGFFGTTSSATWSPWVAAFVDRLRQLGWAEGRTVAIEYRWADGRSERYAEIVAEFVSRKVDIIVTSGAGVPAAKRATSTIPIVFALAVDPLRAGLVASLSRPGGNVTGMSLAAADLAGKRLEIAREVLPRMRRLAIIADVGFAQSVVEMGEVEAAARGLGLEVAKLEIRRAEDIAPAFEAAKGADALFTCTGPLVNTNRVLINDFANAARIPTMHSERVYVESGGLMSYGPNTPEMFGRAADFVDKILRGAKPGDLPVEQPTKFELVINLKTAKALGLTIPESFLLRANELIE